MVYNTVCCHGDDGRMIIIKNQQRILTFYRSMTSFLQIHLSVPSIHHCHDSYVILCQKLQYENTNIRMRMLVQYRYGEALVLG